jgi:hypothetical protein
MDNPASGRRVDYDREYILTGDYELAGIDPKKGISDGETKNRSLWATVGN